MRHAKFTNLQTLKGLTCVFLSQNGGRNSKENLWVFLGYLAYQLPDLRP